MADFDFDELDKAVTGALGKKAPLKDDSAEAASPSDVGTTDDHETEQNLQADTESTSDSSSGLSEEKNTEEIPPKITGVSAPVVAAPRTTPAIKRSSGRFMDMVHPKSDMRTSTASPARPSFSPTPTVFSHPSPKPVAAPAPIEPLQSIDEVFKPQESPFLPDTKVEKRPLGGNSSTADAHGPDLLAAPDTPLLEAETMPDPIDFAIENGHVDLDLHLEGKKQEELPTAPLPEPKFDIETSEAEAQKIEDSEVFEFEAKKEEVAPVEPEKEIEPVIVPEPKVDVKPVIEAESLDKNKPEVAHSEPTELKEDEPTGPTSITQQYKEQASSTAETGAIFDTEAYHQPLAQSVKKKSSVLVIVWILLLVVLGAGAGAAFYLYVLPLL